MMNSNDKDNVSKSVDISSRTSQSQKGKSPRSSASAPVARKSTDSSAPLVISFGPGGMAMRPKPKGKSVIKSITVPEGEGRAATGEGAC